MDKQYSKIIGTIQRDADGTYVAGWTLRGDSDYVLISAALAEDFAVPIKAGERFYFGPSLLLEVQQPLADGTVECKLIKPLLEGGTQDND